MHLLWKNFINTLKLKIELFFQNNYNNLSRFFLKKIQFLPIIAFNTPTLIKHEYIFSKKEIVVFLCHLLNGGFYGNLCTDATVD